MRWPGLGSTTPFKRNKIFTLFSGVELCLKLAAVKPVKLKAHCHLKRATETSLFPLKLSCGRYKEAETVIQTPTKQFCYLGQVT